MSQEDRQRTLLQLQWKVMGDKLQEDQEVNSKKVISCPMCKCAHARGITNQLHAISLPEAFL